jgi:hypothetical protein
MTLQPRSRRLARVVAAGLAVGALAAPPAVAGPIIGPVVREHERGGTAVTVAPDTAVDPRPLVVRAVDDGFDWGSAAIGAGGAGAFLTLASLGAFAYTSRNRVPVAR